MVRLIVEDLSTAGATSLNAMCSTTCRGRLPSYSAIVARLQNNAPCAARRPAPYRAQMGLAAIAGPLRQHRCRLQADSLFVNQVDHEKNLRTGLFRLVLLFDAEFACLRRYVIVHSHPKKQDETSYFIPSMINFNNYILVIFYQNVKMDSFSVLGAISPPTR
jgi:hypothetical protein